MVEKKINSTSNVNTIDRNQNKEFLVKETQYKEREKIPLKQKNKLKQHETLLKEKPKVVEEIREKPVIGEIQEKRQVQRKRKDVIKEQYEQPVIQIEEQPIIKNVERKPLYKKFKENEKVEEYGNKYSTYEQTRNLRNSADRVGVKLTKEYPTVKKTTEKPVVSEISHRDKIRVVNQPVIHEIHEQQIIEEHEQPIIKRYYNKPIIKKVVNEPVFVTEGYEEAGRQRKEDLKPLNKKVVDQVEQTMESNILQDYKGYDKLPFDYEEESNKNIQKSTYADIAKYGPQVRQRKAVQKSKISDRGTEGVFERKEKIDIQRESPLRENETDIAVKNTKKNEMDINRELKYEKEQRKEEKEETEELGLFASFKRLLKNTWNFFFGAFARF